MEKKHIMSIVKWSTLALIIPIIGQLFVDGWNWKWHDFLFAWVFFNALGFSYIFVTSKFTHRTFRIIAGILVIAFFAGICIILATG